MKRKNLLLSLVLLVFLIAGCTNLLPQTTGNIIGEVIDEQTLKPIIKAVVEIESTSKTVLTNSTGSFALEDLNANTYTVKVTKEGYESVTQKFQVYAGQDTTAKIKLKSYVQAPSVGSISGKVVYSGTKNPISGVEVSIEGREKTDITDASGAFGFADLEYGTYTLIASKEGYVTGTKKITLDAEMKEVIIELEEVREIVTVGSLKGKVVNAGTGTPIAGVNIILGEIQQTVVTSEDGAFTFTDLEYGIYTLIASKEGYVTGTKKISLDAETKEVTIGLEEVQEIVTVGSLKGKVVDAGTETPIAGVNIAIEETGQTAVTKEDGTFTFTDLKYGTYTLIAFKEGYVGDFKQIPVNVETVQVTIELEEVQEIPIIGELQGKVVCADTETPIPGVNITLEEIGETTVTNEDGTFIFANLDFGWYSLIVEKEGFVTGVELVIIDKEIVEVIVKLEEVQEIITVGDLEGKVVWAGNDTPIAGTAITIEETGQTAVTKEDGTFTFVDLDFGLYTLIVEKEDYVPYMTNIFIDSENTFLSIKLEKEPIGDLQGKVVWAGNDTPIAGVNITIEETGQTVVTNENGNFIFENLPFGFYTLIFSKEGLVNKMELVVVEKEVASVTIAMEEDYVPSFGDLTGVVVYQGTTEPVDGVVIRIDGTELFTTTDLFGEFAFTDLEYGSYILIASKNGFVTTNQAVTIDQTVVSIDIALEEEISSAKRMIDNFKTGMYQLGTVAFNEESILQENVENELMPFYSEIGPSLYDFQNGLMHMVQIFGYRPGRYVFEEMQDPFDGSNYYDYALVEPSDLTADTHYWIVEDTLNGITVELTIPNYDQHVVENDTYTQIDVDLTGTTFDLVVISANTEVMAQLNVGTTNLKSFTYSETVENDGVVENYVANFIIPSGPTVDFTCDLNVNPADNMNEIQLSGAFNIDTLREDLILDLNGQIKTPVLDFSGQVALNLYDQSTQNINEILTPGQFGIFTSGTFETSAYNISGDFNVEFDMIDQMPIAHSAQMSIYYNSLSTNTKFYGNIDWDFVNYQEVHTSYDYIYPDYIVEFYGDLTSDNYYYSVGILVTRPEEAVMDAMVEIFNNNFTLCGNISYDIAQMLTYIHLTDDYGITLEIDVPDMVGEGDVVGSILDANNVKLADVSYSYTTGAAFMIQYTDGSWELIPLNPLEYLVQ